MNASQRSVFHFHADANPIGGRITQPIEVLLPPQGSSSLAQAGGHSSGRIGPHSVDGLLSFQCAHSEVYGLKASPYGPWETTVSSVIEGLNILDIVRADAIVAKIKVKHPHAGGPPSVSFGGTHFYNLTVAGQEIKPELNLDKFARIGALARKAMGGLDKKDWDRLSEEEKAQKEESEETRLVHALEKEEETKFDQAEKQAQSLVKEAEELVKQAEEPEEMERAKDKLALAKSREGWLSQLKRQGYRGHVLCSLVDKIDGAPQRSAFGHILHVPEVGNLFLGELTVSQGLYRVTMLRAQMGCQAEGDASAACAAVGGQGGSGTKPGPG